MLPYQARALLSHLAWGLYLKRTLPRQLDISERLVRGTHLLSMEKKGLPYPCTLCRGRGWHFLSILKAADRERGQPEHAPLTAFKCLVAFCLLAACLCKRLNERPYFLSMACGHVPIGLNEFKTFRLVHQVTGRTPILTT